MSPIDEEQVEDSSQNHLPPHSKASRERGNLEGERRLVTILFCDVKGSTAMADLLDPEEWTEIMNEAFDYLIAPVVRYGGTVARLMGDGILAVFGAPVAHEDDPQRAILAGLDILEGIHPFQDQIRRDYRMSFDVRIGINTGMAVVGEIGSYLAAEWTAMGDAVNLAARMEQTAQPGTIQVSETTYRLVAPLFELEPLGSVEIKGKPQPLQTYRVLKRGSAPGRLRGLPGLETPLTGRQREMEILRAALDGLALGRGGIACLVGEAGLGKSRLIEELHGEWRQAMGEQAGWLETRGISYDTGRPYGLIRQILRQTYGVDQDEPVPEARKKIMANIVSASGEPASERTFLATEALLAIEEGREGPELEGEGLKRQLFLESAEVFRRLASSGPLVLAGDDLHWADPASIELLVHLFALCEEAPILFLCAVRPYRSSPGWQVKQAAERDYPHRYSEVELHPLTDQDSSALVDGLLAIGNLPEGLRRSILHKAEGNPFFVEEIVRSLIESQAIVRDPGGFGWQAVHPAGEIAIPDTIHALLAARIDRLEKDARQTLQLASVIGRNFAYRVLQKLSGPGVSLDRQLNALERMGLVWEVQRAPEREYAFRHELTRDAVYKTILHRRRRSYHRLAAEAIEVLYPDRLENQAHRLAMHFDQALDRERALKYFTLAGETAARLYANQEATGHYQRAIEIARESGTDEQVTQLYLHLGRCLQNCSRNQEALATYRALEALGEERQNPQMRLAALVPQATLHAIPSAVYNQELGRELSQRALELARRLGDPAAEARSLWNMVLMEVLGGGDPRKAIALGEQSLAIARQHGLVEEQAYVLHDLGRAYFYTGRRQEAWAAFGEAQRLWRELGNRVLLADSLGAEGSCYATEGNFEKAIQVLNEGRSVAQAAGSPWGQAYNQMNLGMVYYERGELAQSIQTLEEANSLGKEAGFIPPQVFAAFFLGWIYGLLGDPGRGLQTIQEFYRQNPEMVPFRREWLYGGQAYLHLLNGQLEHANRLAADIEAHVDLEKVNLLGPLVAEVLGEVSLANGDPEKALAYTEKKLGELEQNRFAMFLPDFYTLKGKALLRLERHAEGIQALETARRTAEEIGSRRDLWLALLALVEAYRQQGDPEREMEAASQAKRLGEYFSSQVEGDPIQARFRERYGWVFSY